MDQLPDSIKETLREFKNTNYFKAYREYVLLQAGKCLAMLRSKSSARDDDMYYKGQMNGVEMLIFDLMQDQITTGEIEKANHDNRDYTEKLIDRDLKDPKK